MIHGVSIPTPFRVGDVNGYLVEDDPLTLVDVGPNSARSLVALEAGLATHGRRVEELERIVITHQHADHLGLVDVLADRSGADGLRAGRARAGGGGLPGLRRAQRRVRAGAAAPPRRAGPGASPRSARSRAATAAGAPARPSPRSLHDGGELDFAGRTFTVHHRPGHSPTDTVFFDAANGDLIAGDHLLAHISSNPLIALPPGDGPETERPHALQIYMASLRAHPRDAGRAPSSPATATPSPATRR